MSQNKNLNENYVRYKIMIKNYETQNLWTIPKQVKWENCIVRIS